MSKEDVKEMMQCLREILKQGPNDKLRGDLRKCLEDISSGKKSMKDLVGALKPLLKSVATGFLDSGNIPSAKMVLKTLNSFSKVS